MFENNDYPLISVFTAFLAYVGQVLYAHEDIANAKSATTANTLNFIIIEFKYKVFEIMLSCL